MRAGGTYVELYLRKLALCVLFALGHFPLAHAGGYYNIGAFWRTPQAVNCSTISFVQAVPSGTSNTEVNTGQQSRTLTATAGNLLVAVVTWASDYGASVSVSDSLGNTWYPAPPQSQLGWDGTFTDSTQIFYAPNIAGGANTVTMVQSGNWDNGTWSNLAVMEYSGVASSMSVDVSSGQIAPSASTTATPGSMTLTSGCSELVVSAFVNDTQTIHGTITLSAGPGWTSRTNNTNWSIVVEDNAPSLSAAGAINAQATLSGSDATWAATQVAFRAAGSAALSQPTKLAITTGTQTLGTTWQCSGALTVQAQNASSQAVPAHTPIDFDLSGSGLYFYSDSTCTQAITGARIYAGASSRTVYFQANTTGTLTLAASSSGLTSTSQNETIGAKAAYTWIGGAGCDGSWGTGACWQGNSVPGSGNVAHFDPGCTTQCTATLSADTTVGKVLMSVGNTDTLDLATHLLTVDDGSGGGDLTIDGGTLSGSSSSFDIGGSLSISGGTVNLSNSTIGVAQNWAVSGGTITTTGSTLAFNDPRTTFNGYSWSIAPGSVSYNNVTFADAPGAVVTTRTLTSTMTVNGTLQVSGVANTWGTPRLSGGTIAAKGNVTVLNSGYLGTTVIQLAGSANQTLDASATTTGFIPALEIASTGGLVKFKGNPIIAGNYTYTSAPGGVDFTTNNSTLVFDDPTQTYAGDSWTITPGPITYNHVSFLEDVPAVPVVRTLAAGSTMNIGGNLVLGSQNAGWGTASVVGGTLAIAGNVTLQRAGFTASSNISVGGNWVNSSSLAFNPGGGTVTFNAGANHTISGNNTFYNLTMDNSGVTTANSLTFPKGLTQTIGGTLYLKGNTTNNLSVLGAGSGSAASLAVPAIQTMGGYLTVQDNRPSGFSLHTGSNSTLVSGTGSTTPKWLSP